jgi:hypothetical protein
MEAHKDGTREDHMKTKTTTHTPGPLQDAADTDGTRYIIAMADDNPDAIADATSSHCGPTGAKR